MSLTVDEYYGLVKKSTWCRGTGPTGSDRIRLKIESLPSEQGHSYNFCASEKERSTSDQWVLGFFIILFRQSSQGRNRKKKYYF